MESAMTFWSGGSAVAVRRHAPPACWHKHTPGELWKLSALLARKHHPPLTLFADPTGAKFLTDLGIEFDSIDTTIVPNGMAGVAPRMWSAGKILSYREMARRKRPFVHIDADAMLFSPLPDRVQRARVFAQSSEKHYRDSHDYYGVQKIIPQLETLPSMQAAARRHIQIAACFGIFGGSDFAAIEDYASEVLDTFIYHRQNAAKLLATDAFLPCIAEQWAIGSMLLRRRIGIEYLLHTDEQFWDRDCAISRGYVHLCAGIKFHRDGRDWVGRQLEEITRPKRLLIFGMPSGGTSVTAWLAAQKPLSAGILDCYNEGPSYWQTPCDTVLKITANTQHGLIEQIAKFKPTATLLVTRNPEAVRRSLESKPWGQERGSIDEKFAVMETARRHVQWDGIVDYDDIVNRRPCVAQTLRRIWGFEDSWWELRRSPEEAADFAKAMSHWAEENWNRGWSLGASLHPERKLAA